MPSEFDIIEQYFKAPAASPDIRLGIGDDAAVIQSRLNDDLLVSVDTLVNEVHFPETMPADLIAYRALAVNISDMAAMGATPAYFTLALTLPWADSIWLADFSKGLHAAAAEYHVALIGGDTTRGPLSITIQVMGYAPAKAALTRAGARVDDDIYVTGSLGDAAAGLAVIQETLSGSDADEQFVIERFSKPTARVSIGQALLNVAHSAIDISDGLLADLSHILKASGVGAVIYTDQVPLSSALRSLVDDATAKTWAMTAGDDYELCFTAAAQQRATIEALAKAQGVSIARIGHVTAQQGLVCLDAQHQPCVIDALGFRHF